MLAPQRWLLTSFITSKAMNKTLTAAMALMASLSCMAEANIPVKNLRVNRVGKNIAIDFRIDPSGYNPGRNAEVKFTPVLRSVNGTDSIEFAPISVVGSTRYYLGLRDKSFTESDLVCRSGDQKPLNYHADVAYQPWMEQSTLTMRLTSATCCKPPQNMLKEPAQMAAIDYSKPSYSAMSCFVKVTGDSAVVMSENLSAFVDFVVNRTEIRPDYRNNRAEIDKILNTINRIKNDADATITEVTFKGFASPEGSYTANLSLAKGRTESLTNYVRKQCNFSNDIMHSSYEAEDWDGLRRWVESSSISNRDAILSIINSEQYADPDAREWKIKSTFPDEYRTLLSDVYPALRHTDFTISYRIRVYATIEELRNAFNTTPERLRPVDFQRLAELHAVGSPEYKAIMSKAIEVYPANQQININMANIAIADGDYAAAERYLGSAGPSNEAVYTRATLAAVQANYERAEQLFASIAPAMPKAQEALTKVQNIMNRQPVTYLLDE